MSEKPDERLASQRSFVIADQSRVAEVRRFAVMLAGYLGFEEAATGRSAIVATEMATNLLRHAGAGELFLRRMESLYGPAVEMLSVDRGPGIENVESSIRDGVSTTGTSGSGLGAMRRLSTEFDIASTPGAGTVVVTRVTGDGPGSLSPPETGPRVAVGGLTSPIEGELVSGDGWAHDTRGLRTIIMVSDGLGHGPAAAEASRAALSAFHAHSDQSPQAIVEDAHSRLRPTRGAAVSVAEVDLGTRTLRFCGVGNVAGRIEQLGAEARHAVSHNGTLGHEAHRFQEFSYPLPPHFVLVLHSDGITSRWRLASYAGLVRSDASIIAGAIYRDHARGRDDATVVVMKE